MWVCGSIPREMSIPFEQKKDIERPCQSTSHVLWLAIPEGMPSQQKHRFLPALCWWTAWRVKKNDTTWVICLILFVRVKPFKAFFDRVVPTIQGVGDVYQTYIIYYESYLYMYICYVNCIDFTRIYIYMSMYVCIPLYLIIRISETKCKSYKI